jgi:hypothetical protein
VAGAAGYPALLGLALSGGVASAAAQRPWLVVAAAALAVAAELLVRLRATDVAELLAHAGAGLPTRAALGSIALVLLAARGFPRSVLVGTAVVGFLVVVATAGFVGLRQLVGRALRPPLVVRNLDLGVASLRPLPRLLVEPPTPGVLAALVTAVGLAIDYHPRAEQHVTAAAAGLSIAALLAVAPTALLAGHLGWLLGSGRRAAGNEAATRAVQRLAPEVVLYFAATPAEVYQVDQWLEAVERLNRPAAVMLRSDAVMSALAPTSLPIICSPYNGTIAALPLPPRVVTLFPTHSGDNLSMIRRKETRTVFVGHGDSDKPDSVNAFARVYDEVWVAGPLGRRRYADAAVGVADPAIVEVGRPQARVPGSPPADPPVVVYAPTWEGWGDDEHHSSLAQVGPQLVRALLTHPGISVRYRPHPLTGVRQPALRRADREVASLVGRVPTAESLAETFAGAAAVIADVSSVIPEFLPYDRPYAVPDTRGLGREAFVARAPSVAAGFVLAPDLAGLDDFVTAATGGPDPTAGDRRALLLDALGDPATSQQRFAAAVERLLNR